MTQVDLANLANAIRTAPLTNNAREALVAHLGANLPALKHASEPRMRTWIERCMGWAPTIGNIGL